MQIFQRGQNEWEQWTLTFHEIPFSTGGDPVIGVHRTYDSTNIAKGVWSNTQGYSNARVDEIMQMAAVENDPEKRKALYSEFQAIIADEVPVYHVNTLPYHTVYSDKIGNPPIGIWATSSPIDMVYLKD